MKPIIFLSSIFLGTLIFGESKAQVHIDVNIGRPVYVSPAPVAVSYYYLPDVEAYYYVPQKVYYYRNHGYWVSSRHLPGYRNYNVYSVRHIAVNGHKPYLRHDYYRSKYHVQRASYTEHNYSGSKYQNGWKNSHTHRGRGRH